LGPQAVAKCIAGMILILLTTLGFYPPYFKTVLEKDFLLLADVSYRTDTSKFC